MTPGPKPQIDTSRPHSGRVYDYLLGGKDHYPVDREVGANLPDGAREHAWQNRAFMHRATEWIAGRGVGQFLDIGTGIPTEPNLHQVVQGIVPAARVVYTDNDPIVLRHAEALLVSRPEGTTDYIQADVRSPESVLEQAREILDFTRPVALSLIGLLHFLPDDEDPYGIVRTLVGVLSSGSYLVLTQGASDVGLDFAQKGKETYERGGIRLALRTREEFARFFDGLDVVEPGLVTTPEWFRDTPTRPADDIGLYGGVARVP
jgi:S-adenosyl methyltransferase